MLLWNRVTLRAQHTLRFLQSHNHLYSLRLTNLLEHTKNPLSKFTEADDVLSTLMRCSCASTRIVLVNTEEKESFSSANEFNSLISSPLNSNGAGIAMYRGMKSVKLIRG